MHLDTVGGLYYSADYPYTLAKALAAVKGDDMVTVFTIGTCRRHQPHQRRRRDQPQKGHGEAARIGTRLAAEVLRTFEKLKPAADGPLRVSSETVELPLAPVTAEDVGRGEAGDRGRAGGGEAGPEVPRPGAGVQGGRRGRPARQAAGGRGAGDLAGRRPRVGEPAGRDLRASWGWRSRPARRSGRR